MDAIETQSGVTLAVSAVNLATGESVQHQSSEPLPMCSLFKVIAVGALLKAHAYDEQYLNTPVPFSADQIVVNSPVASKLGILQMTPNEMADAALRYSDNTAGNLLLEQIGGPAAIRQLAQQLGATSTRLDRAEPELNEGIPGDLRDTTTADDMVTILRALLIDGQAGQLTQSKLQDWMLQNTTSGARARAGLSGSYELADKTGAGGYGIVNDAGVLWQGGSGPIVFSILTRTDDPAAKNNNDVIAQAMRLITLELQ
ncbi:class A beta-lactamase [Microbacterium testaceum]|uniref:class A beta-lactamase n=1 Tax=Microbacterium testaceum TaxID=2033 RepID=UPI003420BEBA